MGSEVAYTKQLCYIFCFDLDNDTLTILGFIIQQNV